MLTNRVTLKPSVENRKVGLAVISNIFKTVKLVIQRKPHGEPQYIEEFEVDRPVKVEKRGWEGVSPEAPSGVGTPQHTVSKSLRALKTKSPSYLKNLN